MTKIALFTDTNMVTDGAGGYYPLRDQFPLFISKLAEYLENFYLASRCRLDPKIALQLDRLPQKENFKVVELPFYENTEDFYKRHSQIVCASVDEIKSVVGKVDAVILRLNHSLAKEIAAETRRAGKPLLVYWAGPSILRTVCANYPGWSPKDIGARIVAYLKQRTHKRIAHASNWNFFIDSEEFAEMGSPEKAQWVVPTLVESNHIHDSIAKRESKKLVVSFAGRIYQHKGIFDLLCAVMRLNERGLKVYLQYAGQGTDESRLSRRISQYGLSEFVKLLGPLPHAQLQHFLRASHVFVLPSFGEGLPKVLWEAWSNGLAVITTPVGSIPSYVKNNETGLLVSPGNVDEIEVALERIYFDENLRQHLAVNGLNAVKNHTWTNEIIQIESGIRNVLMEKAASEVRV